MHQPVGFGEGDYDFLVMKNFFEIEGTAFSVFQPFLGR
jgi:hypothetical protein